jgi:hypothetical protein
VPGWSSVWFRNLIRLRISLARRWVRRFAKPEALTELDPGPEVSLPDESGVDADGSGQKLDDCDWKPDAIGCFTSVLSMDLIVQEVETSRKAQKSVARCPATIRKE